MDRTPTEASKIDEYLASIPTSASGIVSRAMVKTGGRQNAIKAKCLTCSNWQRDEIANCRVVICPLHAWRPFQARG